MLKDRPCMLKDLWVGLYFLKVKTELNLCKKQVTSKELIVYIQNPARLTIMDRTGYQHLTGIYNYVFALVSYAHIKFFF